MKQMIWLLAGLAVMATASSAVAREPGQVVMPAAPANRALFEKWGFAEAVIDGDRIYLSGVVADLRGTETDPSAGFDRAFKTIAGILQRSGATWDDVVDMTTYHTDLPSQLDAFVAVKRNYVREPFPAWTAIDIDRLVPDRGLVEIKVVARRPPDATSPK
ncbi:RidA family protein [Sphingomonas sp.]|uniref:RidA family protein n=1 Tax=Sphingomonas sp. TaxID=28214 RepID=UPI00286E80A8|nr:RidA family protein [Sphingomonas sp.]